MKLTVLGFGGAGCRLADRLRAAETDERPYLTGVRAFDVDSDTLETLDLPEECCRAFHPDRAFEDASDDADATDPVETERPTEEPNRSATEPNRNATEASQYATGASRHAAETIRTAAERNVVELRRVASDAVTAETDGLLVVAGLGGGTGAGATPVVVDALRDIHDLPVYAVSVLPAADEDQPAAANAAAGLRALEAAVDSQLLFDGGAFSDVDERPETPAAALEAYDEANRRIAEQVSVLFDAGESSTTAGVGERVLDTSELVATLGESGYAMLGYRREQVREEPSMVDRLLSRTAEVDSVTRYSTIETAVRRALLRHRSIDAESVLGTAERALLVAVGPPEWLDRDALADGRRLLTEETGGAVVRGADAPAPDDTDLRLLAVCAGLDRPERVTALLDDEDA